MSKLRHLLKPFLIIILFASCYARASNVRGVEIRDNQLVVDGKNQPQLFGAEVQYFRLRGGYGPNISRAVVLALWNKALDHLVAAKMNAISFYIPWDFHEYAEGKFDFDGTVDLDQDGRADYPSRDLHTFFELIANRGITRIMVRPGPYINAEWGFLGFGSIPMWFHNKYPNSHMRTPFGLRSRLYDYHDQDLARNTAVWFKTLNQQVLSKYLGPNKPILFVQLDNETNFQWQSIFNHDFGQNAIFRYQKFLQDLYKDIEFLNIAHGRKWDRWTQIQPPMYQGRNIAEDQAWYQFADFSIFTYLSKIRDLWTSIGVDEPDVLFTLAESYNAPTNGLLPNFLQRNAKQVTGLMTVNLYPKTFETESNPLLNFPFKADLDVKAADEANDSYFGSHQEWVLGPEIQGGWWRGVDISTEARQQTYLTVLGHGLKAFFVYYFNEGQNWDVDWSHQQIKPLYEELLWERRLQAVSMTDLPENFWNELQARCDRKILLGFDVRRIMKLGPSHDMDLYFDAPLDGQADPSKHYSLLKNIGENIVAPYQDFLARSLEVHDEIALVKDSTSHSPVADPNISSVQASADWTGGLLGYLLNADINPRILHGELSSEADFLNSKVLVHLDTGLNDLQTVAKLKKASAHGRMIINFLASAIAKQLEIDIPSSTLFSRDSKAASLPLEFYIDSQGQVKPAGTPGTRAIQFLSSSPIYQYNLNFKKPNCEGILYSQQRIVGYRCQSGASTFIQIGALIFEDYNSNAYALMKTPLELKQFLKSLLRQADVRPSLELSENTAQTVAFARKDPEKELLWITVKTGLNQPQTSYLKVNQKVLQDALRANNTDSYSIADLISKRTVTLKRSELINNGAPIDLLPNGSTVYVVKTIP